MSDTTQQTKVTYLKDFDGVRGIAALMVMVYHFFFNYINSPKGSFMYYIAKASMFGQTGVTLFFVLSGFLITRILLNTKKQDNYFQTFYVRRVLRIFPLYYLFLIIFFFVNPLINGNQIISADKQWYYWVYLQNFAITFNWDNAGPIHYWSLAVEEHFYLFWPIIVCFVDTKHLSKIIYLIICFAIVMRYILFSNGYEVFYFTFTTMDALAIGSLLAIQERNEIKSGKMFPNKFILLFFSTLIPLFFLWFIVSGKSMLWLQVFKFLLISVVYYSLLGCLLVSNKNGVIKKILCSKPLQYTGKISYGLYVYHILCFQYFSCVQTKYIIVNFIGSFSLAYIVSGLSYRLFESKFLVLKKHFEYKN